MHLVHRALGESLVLQVHQVLQALLGQLVRQAREENQGFRVPEENQDLLVYQDLLVQQVTQVLVENLDVQDQEVNPVALDNLDHQALRVSVVNQDRLDNLDREEKQVPLVQMVQLDVQGLKVQGESLGVGESQAYLEKLAKQVHKDREVNQDHQANLGHQVQQDQLVHGESGVNKGREENQENQVFSQPTCFLKCIKQKWNKDQDLLGHGCVVILIIFGASFYLRGR